MSGTPGKNRTYAHGLGNQCSIHWATGVTHLLYSIFFQEKGVLILINMALYYIWHCSHIDSGTNPIFINLLKIKQPAQNPTNASNEAKSNNKLSIASLSKCCSTMNKYNVSDEQTKPIICANRFGGPATFFFGRLGAIILVTNWPIGLKVGPVSTRAINPYNKKDKMGKKSKVSYLQFPTHIFRKK